MKQALHIRLARLEQQAALKVIGLRWLNAEWDDDGEKDPTIVRFSGSEEKMSVAEFERRYPQG